MLEAVRGVLFDLDGTFADTAGDLGTTLNRLRAQRGQPPVPLEALRPFTSQGVRGLLRRGMDMTPEHAEYAGLAEAFLEIYAADICTTTTLFPGMPGLLARIEGSDRCWGIVTNKAQRFTLPLMNRLGLAERAACIVSGDSSPRPKPHPEPMLLAAALAGVAPAECVYVGDDIRDIAAGAAAGMLTIAVRYGYLGCDAAIESWGADLIVDHPDEISALLG